MAVTPHDVLALLNSDLDDPQLVLQEGALTVVSGESAGDFRTGLTIASAAEVRSDLGATETLDEGKVATVAAILDQRVAQLGA